MQILAALSNDSDKPLNVAPVELDAMRADEVMVRMAAVGVCHTDAVVHRKILPRRTPAVLGHEGTGIVEAVGREVANVSPGDHVVLSFAWCGRCTNCVSRHPAYCTEKSLLNFSGGRADGSSSLSLNGQPVGSHFFGQSSFATFANVSARCVIKVPQEISLPMLAPLGCSVQTGAGSVFNVLAVEPGRTIGIFGVGAVGSAALLAAKVARTAMIIAVDRSEDRLRQAAVLGADHTINSLETDSVAAIMDLTGGQGINYALDTTGSDEVFTQIIAALAIRGAACLVGAAMPNARASFGLAAGLSRGLTIHNCIEGDSLPREFIPHLIELHANGEFSFDKLLRMYNFAEINHAMADSEAGRTVKAVLCFPS